MLKKEYEILLQFVKEPWKRFTFKEIKNLSRKKSESYVYNSIKRFVKSKILKEEKVGNVILYSVNLTSLKAQAYSGFTSEHYAWSQKHIPYKDLESLSSKIPTPFYTLIITGSYAKKNQTKNSDIDLVIIIDEKAEPRKVYSQLKLACELNIPEIHLYVFRKSEFLQMLLNSEANYGREIVKNNLILFGAETYYRILGEAIETGFNNKNSH